MITGDARHHKPVPHAAQFLYWLLFMIPVLGPFALLTEGLQVIRQHPVKIVFASVVLATGLPWITFDHPYLLADNRHYAFYLWKRVFSKDWSRVVFSPVYVTTFVVVWRRLRTCMLRDFGTTS
jgi:alpha-1,2-glucosyltransferase